MKAEREGDAKSPSGSPVQVQPHSVAFFIYSYAKEAHDPQPLALWVWIFVLRYAVF